MSSELSFSAGASAALTVRTSARARGIRLSVDPRTGTILLTVPRRTSSRRALAWAATQQPWIDAALARIPPAVPITPGAIIPLFGEPHEVVWLEGAPRRVRLEAGRILAGGPLEMLPGRILRWLRQQAAEMLARETRECAESADVVVGPVGVGDPVSRWGSCSSSGSIRYSWRLILAPQWVRRATVAHEVAHRVHMNHGPQFHALVAQLFGADPKPARQWLRKHGPALHRVGRD